MEECMPDEAHEFATRLRSLMARRGLKQVDVAAQIGVSTRTMWLYYNGKRLPNVRNARRLRRFLKCTWEELLGL